MQGNGGGGRVCGEQRRRWRAGSVGADAGLRFTMEATFHKTLTTHDVDAGDPPSTDFVKLGFGFVF